MKTLLPLLFAIATLALAQTTDTQSWTASDGRVIQAKFIKLEGEAVVIDVNGKRFTVPFAKLAPASVVQAKKVALANRPRREPLAPAATATPGTPHVLPLKDSLFIEGWLADGAKGGSSDLLTLHCDDMGDLILPVGTLTERGAQRGLVKLSSYDGSPMWTIAPQDLAEGGWKEFKVVKDNAGDYITAGNSEGADKAHDIAVAKVEGSSGKVIWKWRFDGAQKGDDRLGGVAVDAAGHVILAIDSGGKPAPAERGRVPQAPWDSVDSVIVKLDGKTGKPLWEARDHAVAGARDAALLSDPQPAGIVLIRHIKDKAANQLVGLDPATGKVLWQVEGGGRDRLEFGGRVTPRGTLHSDGKQWMLTGLDGKNLWSVPRLFNERETVMTLSDSTAWIDWLLQDIKGDVVNYTSTVGLLNLQDGTVPVKKEPLAGPTDLANPAPPGQLEYPYYAGVQDKSGDLLFLGCGPLEGERYGFKPKLSRISAKDGSVVWTKALDTTTSKNPGYKPFLRLDEEGNLVYLWQEKTEIDITVDGRPYKGSGVISLAKISPTDGNVLWHQRIAGTLGGTVSATNWQLDAAGNVFVVFSAPGRFGAGPASTDFHCFDTLKFNGATGAVEWLRAVPIASKIEFAPGTTFKATAKESAASIQLASAKFSETIVWTAMVNLNNAVIASGAKPEDFQLKVPDRNPGAEEVTLRMENVTLAAFLEKIAELTNSTLEWTDKAVTLVGKAKP